MPKYSPISPHTPAILLLVLLLYYEWETRDAQQSLLEDTPSLQIDAGTPTGKGKSKSAVKIKYAIRTKSPGGIFLAGIYRYEENQKLLVLSILTQESVLEIAFIHDRMPMFFFGQAAWTMAESERGPNGRIEVVRKRNGLPRRVTA